MERVSDVECANCTLQKELQDLEEEVDLLRGAVQSVDRRRKQQQKQNRSRNTTSIISEQEDDSLHHELMETEQKLNQLKRQDPDDYEIRKDDHPNSPTKLLRSEALKCLILTRCPSVLCLHVQRRYYDPMKDRMSKNLQHVFFDQVLDLSPFCAYGGQRAAAGFAGRGRKSPGTEHQNSPIRYRLTCVIEHKGNAFGGHYVCYRRLPSQLQRSNTCVSTSNWYFCSDETIHPTTWDAVRRCQAYMLLYEAI
jgi:ubiquitin carboxyl-terminal hydrolase 1